MFLGEWKGRGMERLRLLGRGLVLLMGNEDKNWADLRVWETGMAVYYMGYIEGLLKMNGI